MIDTYAAASAAKSEIGRRIPSLDGLRAISFLTVFLSHVFKLSAPPQIANLIPGGFGVTIFFFLSGFLITTLMQSEYDRHNAINFRHFWFRRCLRILPPFYLILAAATIESVMWVPQSFSWKAAAAQGLHISNYWIIYHGEAGLPALGGTAVYWSLAVEEHFYTLFPLVYVSMRKLGLTRVQQAKVLLGICAIVLLWRCFLVLCYHVEIDRTYMSSDTRVDSIMFGCALAVTGIPRIASSWQGEWRWKYVYIPLIFVLLTGTFLFQNQVFRETARYSIQGLLLMPIFIAAMRFPDWAIFRILNTKPMIYIGTLSYTLYLVHYCVLLAIRNLTPSLAIVATGCLALAICLAISWAIHVAVERPCTMLRRRIRD